MRTPLLILILLGLELSACSSPGYNHGRVGATPTPSPTPTPPEPTPPPTFWGCKVSNGAGRVFRGIGDSMYMAERDARAPCERQYRTCVMIDCKPGVSKDFRSPF